MTSRRPKLATHGASVDGQRVRTILERIERRAQGAQLHSSTPRERVVRAVLAAGKHFTVDDIRESLVSLGEHIGQSTVYRALRLLAESGVLVERHFGEGTARYELAEEAGQHHDHLICTRCGTITEFEEPQIEELQVEIAARYGFELRSHLHELYGLCPACARAGR